jgi:hypothetical protein
MRKYAIILGIALALCGSTAAFGQDMPRVEIFGGSRFVFRLSSPKLNSQAIS